MEINSLGGMGSQSVGGKTGGAYLREQGNFLQTLAQMQKLQNVQKQPENGAPSLMQNEQAEQTAGGARDIELWKACQQIEAIFIQQMLRQMRATVPQSEFLPQGMAADLYQEMLDGEYSKLMAESPNSLGIAKMLYKQLNRADSPERPDFPLR